jgi:hypothetical protein
VRADKEIREDACPNASGGAILKIGLAGKE